MISLKKVFLDYHDQGNIHFTIFSMSSKQNFVQIILNYILNRQISLFFMPENYKRFIKTPLRTSLMVELTYLAFNNFLILFVPKLYSCLKTQKQQQCHVGRFPLSKIHMSSLLIKLDELLDLKKNDNHKRKDFFFQHLRHFTFFKLYVVNADAVELLEKNK